MEKKEEKTAEAPVEQEEVKPVEMIETITEYGLGLRMPDGSVLDLRDEKPGVIKWMAHITQELNEIKKNIVG